MSQRRYVIAGTRTPLDGLDEVLIMAMLSQDGVDDSEPRDELHHGANPNGVDAFVPTLGRKWNMTCVEHPADWNTHGRAAGPIRNRSMIAEAKPHKVYAFPRRGEANRGTLDLVQAALAAEVEVLVTWLPQSR